mmetsp:Transcript_21065/g.66165  ORF Transcript_21065/g.66165 Transcript_21065/m.66165 type:complete len:363 (-) Transcript_21065:127-1215(-)
MGEGQQLIRPAHAQLEAGGLPARELAQVLDEVHHLVGVGEGGMGGRAEAVRVHSHAPCLCNRRRDLALGEDASMRRLGPLRKLDLHHAHARCRHRLLEALGVELAVERAAPKVARSNVPDDVPALLEVVPADASLSSVMEEVPLSRSAVERTHSVLRERTVAHGGNVEDGSGVGVGSRANEHARVLHTYLLGVHGVVCPLVACGVDVLARAKRQGIARTLAALVGNGAPVSGDGVGLELALDEVLPDLGADGLKDIAQAPEHWVIAQDCVARLVHVAEARPPVEGHWYGSGSSGDGKWPVEQGHAREARGEASAAPVEGATTPFLYDFVQLHMRIFGLACVPRHPRVAARRCGVEESSWPDK